MSIIQHNDCKGEAFPSQRLRVRVFWVCFLGIYLTFLSFSCGRADRLWRISDIYDAAVPVLLKPYGMSYLWYEQAGWLIRPVENMCLAIMISLAMDVPHLPRRTLSFLNGLGWLFLHCYEHSLTGGSHTHVLPAICMMCLALPPAESLMCIRLWNVHLLFSAGLSKLFNGDHHHWAAWMDGQSMRFYFINSRIPVPEPWYSLTIAYDWFAAAQCAGSVLFECSTFLVLFSQTYRLAFPVLGAAFHGVIWYTLGVNYLTSVIIQWTLVLDDQDWARARALIAAAAQRVQSHRNHCHADAPVENPAKQLKQQQRPLSTTTSSPSSSPMSFARLVVLVTAVAQVVTIIWQVEYWPLTPIPMYSGYRPAVGYNQTHIADRKYLDHLVNEMAPHVWSRRWTDVVISDVSAPPPGHADPTQSSSSTPIARYHLHFCAPSRGVPNRGVKEACLVPHTHTDFDTEHGSQALSSPGHMNTTPVANSSDELGYIPLRPTMAEGSGNWSARFSMRPGGWGRQKPIVVVATLPGKAHVYCESDAASLTPAEDFLYRQCAFLHALPWAQGRTLEASLVVHLGTGDLTVGSVACDKYADIGYRVDRVPPCLQRPWGLLAGH